MSNTTKSTQTTDEKLKALQQELQAIKAAQAAADKKLKQAMNGGK